MKPIVRFHFVCLCVLLALLSMGTQSGFAQADPPLSFANNYFVRGDFTVAGAQGMLSNFTTINGNSYAVGTITVPDTNPGIKPSVLTGKGSNAVPANAEVIAAVLYWQTVEKVGVTLGGPGSGQNGFFRPVISGGPAAPGYPISGVSLSSVGTNTVSWSAGGCTSGSTGKLIRTYRANVLGALPRDASGNVSPNVKYEVRVPGTSSTTPIAVGASLVLIYRILDPKVPLNSIVIYDGDYAPSNTSLIMSQTMQGFYDAAHNAISRLAHIVGNGKSNKFETVYLNNQALPSLYSKGQPPFPGYYGSWDNTVWTFDPTKKYVNLSNPVTENSGFVTTEVVPSSSMQGCVSWGASIISTTVKNTDGDGLLDAWKKVPTGYPNPGYCDAAVNEGHCTPGSASWVDLPGAKPGNRDVFIQLDYMCSRVNADGSCTTGDGTNYSFDPSLHADPNDHNYNAVQKVVNAYASHGFTLHINPPSANQSNLHATPEPFCQDDTTTSPPSLCAFPNSPGTSANLGVVTWPGGFNFLKSQLIDSNDPSNLTDCATSTPPAYCIPRFQPAAAPSKHYLLLGHAVGTPEWALVGGTLTNVSQSGNTVTFTTSSPVGVLDTIGTDINGNSIPDLACPNGRITVIGASTNPDLDGTFCISNPTNPLGNTFSILIGGSAMKVSYKLATDPNLAVAPGFTGTASGVSDVGGANSYISLGLWGNPAFSGQNAQTSPASDGQKASVIAGTIMHELGHGNALAHGGPAAYVAQNTQSLLSVTTNCKPNYLSAMSYSRQVDFAPDYSGASLGDLNESTNTGTLNIADLTSWYVPWPLKDSNGNTIVDSKGNDIGTPAKALCSGEPLPLSGSSSMMRVTGPGNTFSFLNVAANPDINFDGTTSDLAGADDWHNLDLAQIDATGADSNSSGQRFNGGGQRFNGGGQRFNGGGQRFNGGGQRFNGGGQRFNGGGEIDTAIVNSITRPPQNLTAAEAASARTITLNWMAPTFGQIGAYNVYRSKNGGPFTIINAANTNPPHTVVGNPPGTTFTDTIACDSGGYRYFVTAVLANTSPEQESVPSNTVSQPDGQNPLTGCYIVSPITLPASAVHGSLVTLSWTLEDDFYTTKGAVTNQAASTLIANGPIPGTCAPGSTTILLKGIPQSGASTFGNTDNGQFTFNWDTDAFCAGSYTFTLTLDSTQQQTTPPLQLQIDVNDTDTTPHITTVSVADATVGVAYSNSLYEDGGVGDVSWSLAQGSSPLPGGITLSPSGVLSGTPIVPAPGAVNFTAQVFNFTVQVKDSANPQNVGTQALTLRLIAPVSFNRSNYATGKNPSPVISGDFNHDGKLDLATANAGDNSVSILLGNGDGTFTAAASSPLPAGTNPDALAAVDLNNDGNLDLVVANAGFNNLVVFLSNGDGTFQAGVPYSVGAYPSSVVAGDFNGDHIPDLAVANQNDHSVSILLGNGDGTFQPGVAYPAGTTDVANVAVGDFNRDGKLDLAVTNPSADTISILIGNGDGTFPAPVTYATGDPAAHPIAVTVFDFNGDGKLDLAVTNLNAKNVAILLGNGDGTFQSRVTYTTTNGIFMGPSAITTGDFNGDGKIDLATSNQEYNTASILLGNGDGTFQNALEFSTGNFASTLAAGDFNGDGRLDLAVTNYTDSTVSVLLHLPQPPTNVVKSSVTATQVALAWTASSSTVTGYNVYQATTSGGTYAKLNATPVPGNAYTDTTVTHGTPYYYVVRAVDANGLESVNSNEVTATP